MTLDTMAKLVTATKEHNISESWVKNRQIESVEDVNQLVTEWQELLVSVAESTKQAETDLSNRAEADIAAWTAK